jgi:hypothetical protein
MTQARMIPATTMVKQHTADTIMDDGNTTTRRTQTTDKKVRMEFRKGKG